VSLLNGVGHLEVPGSALAHTLPFVRRIAPPNQAPADLTHHAILFRHSSPGATCTRRGLDEPPSAICRKK